MERRGTVETDCELRKVARAPRSFHSASYFGWIPVGVLTVLYVALIAERIGRHLWFDELLTYHLADAADLTRMLHLVRRWDLSPPLSHILAFFSIRVAGGNPIAVRYPSVVEFYLASLFFYRYAGRKLGEPYGALAVIAFWVSPMFQYATEGRPYALLCFWFCLLLVLWDGAVEGERAGWLFATTAFASAGLLCSHVLAPLSLLPFLLAEAHRFRLTGRSDYRLWASLFLPLALVFTYIPFYRNFKNITEFPFAFQASTGTVAAFYWHTFNGVVAFLIVVAITAYLAARTRLANIGLALTPPRLLTSDVTLFSILALVPLLVGILMKINHAPFWGRYCITSAIAICFLLTLFLRRFLGRPLSAGQTAFLTGAILLALWKIVLPLSRYAAHPAPANASVLLSTKPELPLVAASGLTFVEMGQYENPQLVARLFYLQDRAAATRFAHATLFEDLDEFVRDLKLPGTVEPYSRFTREHSEFLVYGTFDYPEDWLLRKLSEDGAVIRLILTIDAPYKDRSVYEVHLAGAAARRKSPAVADRGPASSKL